MFLIRIRLMGFDPDNDWLFAVILSIAPNTKKDEPKCTILLILSFEVLRQEIVRSLILIRNLVQHTNLNWIQATQRSSLPLVKSI
jgi:hypothetical protein